MIEMRTPRSVFIYSLRSALLLSLSMAISACTHVEAWQKERIAARHMRFDSTPLESTARQHMYTSREAASGGYGISGGGCGCN